MNPILETIQGNIDDLIKRHGWMVTGVGGDDGTPPFVYTIGLTELRLPELLLTGLSPNTGGAIVNSIAERMFINKETLNVGPQPNGFTVPGGYPLRLHAQPVNNIRDALGTYLVQARNRYAGNMVGVMQLLWGDDKNVLPTEPGYSILMPQPIV